MFVHVRVTDNYNAAINSAQQKSIHAVKEQHIQVKHRNETRHVRPTEASEEHTDESVSHVGILGMCMHVIFHFD